MAVELALYIDDEPVRSATFHAAFNRPSTVFLEQEDGSAIYVELSPTQASQRSVFMSLAFGRDQAGLKNEWAAPSLLSEFGQTTVMQIVADGAQEDVRLAVTPRRD